MDIAAMKMPSDKSFDLEDSDAVDQLCASEPLQDMAIAFHEEFNKTKWQYYGGQSYGQFENYPAYHWTPCDDYDPRYRPWYAAAASGPKDVIILISTYLLDDDRALVEEAALAVVDTLSMTDYAQVVMFDGTSAWSAGKKLVDCTEDNKDELREFISEELAEMGGSADFSLAFTEAYKILKDSEGIDRPNCHVAILFLSDGDNRGPSPLPVIEENTDYHAIVFAYTLGDYASVTRDQMRQVACATDGVPYDISSEEADTELKTAMAGYFGYFAIGQTDAVERWSDIYTDKSGLGRMFTVAAPVYNKRDDSVHFMGVVGTDVTVVETGETEANLRPLLYDMSIKCEWFKLTDAQLTKLQNNACDAQFPVWGIVLIVIGSIIVVSALGAVIYIRWKRNR